MADIANAAILASLVVGMVSIPAASGTIDGGTSIPEPVDNISSTQSVPVSETTELSSDSFTKTVETAFSSFSTSVTSGQVEGELETPATTLEVKKSSGRTEWVMKTSRGTLTVTRSSDKVTEKTETPYGTLEEIRQNGNIRTSFQGSNREKTEKIAGELRDLMKQKKQEYQEKASSMRTERFSEGISLDVHKQTPESITISNKMNRRIDLTGWKVTNDNGREFEINTTLAAGQKLWIFTAEADDEAVENVTENDRDLYRYDSGLGWDNDEDKATLYDDSGNEIEKLTY